MCVCVCVHVCACGLAGVHPHIVLVRLCVRVFTCDAYIYTYSSYEYVALTKKN
jgi:hypothetical protein